jgi:hypothetical protein
MRAPRRRNKEALRTRREGPVRFGSAISRCRISAGRLLMVVWESVVGAGSGVCRCDMHMAISTHSVGVCYSFVTYMMAEKRGVVGTWMIP